MKININSILLTLVFISIWFLSINLNGEDKWQKGKKYSDLYSPKDSMIYRIYNGFQKDNYYLYRGEKYYSLYPLLNTIKESDPEISTFHISAYKINEYALSAFSLINILSYGVFIASTAWCFVSFDVNGKTYPYIGYSFLSIIGSAGMILVCKGIESGLANGIRDNYNSNIGSFNKSIGLELNYKF